MATKIFRGTTTTQIAKIDNGRIFEGTSTKQIAKVDGV